MIEDNAMNNFKHYISICSSNFDKRAKKIDLLEAIDCLCLPEYASINKDDSLLIFQGYSSEKDEYAREYAELDEFSSIFIDCDNDGEDPDIIEKWKEDMKDWDYLLYETHSSTKDRPKFRAIVPMDGILKWDRYAKAAIFEKFKKYADKRASWFYAPTRGKLNTIIDHMTGTWYPSESIRIGIEEEKRRERMEQDRRLVDDMRRILSYRNAERNEDGWRNLPSVKHCLEGLVEGERDDSLNRACYAMKRNGYGDKISEFLSEVNVPTSFKLKFRMRYR